jgi:ribose-phosphate pyrophosphokinase
VLSGKAFENIENSAMEELVVTDTIPLRSGAPAKVTVASVSELFAVAIRNAWENKSIHGLFVHSHRKGL